MLSFLAKDACFSLSFSAKKIKESKNKGKSLRRRTINQKINQLSLDISFSLEETR